MPWLHRDPHDGPLHRRHGRGTREGNMRGADWKNGNSRRDCRRGRVALFRLCWICCRQRHGNRWRSNHSIRTKNVMEVLHYGEESVSVAMEEVKPGEWAHK